MGCCTASGPWCYACDSCQLPAAVQLAAVREAYTDTRSQAEAAHAQLQELTRSHADLGKRSSLSLQQVSSSAWTPERPMVTCGMLGPQELGKTSS